MYLHLKLWNILGGNRKSRPRIPNIPNWGHKVEVHVFCSASSKILPEILEKLNGIILQDYSNLEILVLSSSAISRSIL